MKKYFKLGLSVFIPIAIVVVVFYWFYNIITNVILFILPTSLEHHWWYVFPFIIGLLLIFTIIGFLLSKIKVLKWIKIQFDKIMDKFPLVGRVYSFGLEISDALVEDGKLDGAISVVEFDWNDWITCVGLLTSAENHLIASATVPNPTNGFLFKVHPDHYRKSEMTVEEYGKIVLSMGKLGGSKWKRLWIQTLKGELPFTDLSENYNKGDL